VSEEDRRRFAEVGGYRQHEKNAPHPADERPIRGLTTPAGHRVTRAGIDRALDTHQRAGRIRSWWYSDRAKNERTVLLADGPAQGLGDRDAYHLVIGMKAAAVADLDRLVRGPVTGEDERP
jgi:hypothetical protein